VAVRIKEENERQTNVEELMELLQNFTLIWEKASGNEKREIVVNKVKGVRVYRDDRVEVEFNL
jgi:hypothetical protein